LSKFKFKVQLYGSDRSRTAMEIAQEHNRHEEEVKQLQNAKAVLEQQLAVMRRRMETEVTEHSRTRFDLRRKHETMQVQYSLYHRTTCKPDPHVPFSLHPPHSTSCKRQA
jgi:hypothetical protein